MKIQYKSTLDEAVDTNMELVMSLDTTKRNKFIGLIGGPLFFIIVYFLEDDENIWFRIFLALMIACLYIFIYLILYKKMYRNNIKKLIEEVRGTNEAIDAEYELRDNQLIYRENNQCIGLDWSSMTSVVADENSITIKFKNKGIAMLRNHIFKNDEEKKVWIDFIENKLKNINTDKEQNDT